MKKYILLGTLFILLSVSLFAQSNVEIANVYFKKAEKSMEKIDYKSAKVNFDKGLKILEKITKPNIAQQGAFIYYELKFYDEAKGFAKQFLNLSRNKSSEDYQQMLELYVDMEEKILEKKEQEEKKEKEKLAKEAELKKIDSLKAVWLKMKEKFTLKIDSLYKFNKKGIALFKKNGFYGIIDDKGNVIVEADIYKAERHNEGYFILMDDNKSPEKIYSYNSNSEQSIEFVQPSKYHEDLTNYGRVTLPRGDGKIVLYPNEINETLVYDLKEEKFVNMGDTKEFLKELKKDDKVDKYDGKEGTIKIEKDWYLLGNDLGGKVYTLYSVENQRLFGYMFADEKEIKILKRSQIGYLSSYYSNKLASIDSKFNQLWFTNNGEEASRPMLNNKYKGDTRVVKVDGGYHLVNNEANVFLRNQKLDKLKDFLKKSK